MERAEQGQCILRSPGRGLVRQYPHLRSRRVRGARMNASMVDYLWGIFLGSCVTFPFAYFLGRWHESKQLKWSMNIEAKGDEIIITRIVRGKK